MSMDTNSELPDGPLFETIAVTSGVTPSGLLSPDDPNSAVFDKPLPLPRLELVKDQRNMTDRISDAAGSIARGFDRWMTGEADPTALDPMSKIEQITDSTPKTRQRALVLGAAALAPFAVVAFAVANNSNVESPPNRQNIVQQVEVQTDAAELEESGLVPTHYTDADGEERPNVRKYTIKLGDTYSEILISHVDGVTSENVWGIFSKIADVMDTPNTGALFPGDEIDLPVEVRAELDKRAIN